eukprot:7180736-Pyramimonas_sp.AAC.1
MEREVGGNERVFWENKNPTQDVGINRLHNMVAPKKVATHGCTMIALRHTVHNGSATIQRAGSTLANSWKLLHPSYTILI